MFGSLAFAIIWMTPLAIGHDVALHWVQHDGAATCIGDHELAAAVTARLGNAPARGQTRLVIDGEIAPSGSGWTAAIHTADEHGVVLGQRDLHEPAADCRALDDKLVLVIALIIDPELLDEAPAPPAIERVVVAAPWHVGASVAALASRGMLPGFGFGTAIAARIEPPWGWPIEISTTLWPYDRANAAPGGATLLQLTGGLAICPRLAGPLAVCAGVQAGEVRARGFGFDRNELEHEVVLDGTLELRFDRRFGTSAGVRIGAGAWVPAARPQYVVHEASSDVVVYQPAVVAFVSEIALWVRFGS
ncbi:MAG: hypothetical protein ABI591_18810 [Kofleriaceae bacterium]